MKSRAQHVDSCGISKWCGGKFNRLMHLNESSKLVFCCRRSRADLVVSIGVIVLVVLEPLPLCQSRVSFGYLDFQGTSPQGALYPLGPFTLWGTLPFGVLCPQGPFALRGPLPFMIFYFLGHLDFLGLLGSFLIAGRWD